MRVLTSDATRRKIGTCPLAILPGYLDYSLVWGRYSWPSMSVRNIFYHWQGIICFGVAKSSASIGEEVSFLEKCGT